jgi:hypothetical protein
VAITRTFRDRLDGAIESEEALGRVRQYAPEAAFSNGFLVGACGAEPLPES